MIGRRFHAISLALVMLAGAATAIAQTYQGGLRGQARDQGGVLPGADVSLVNEATGAERTSTTNDVGEYAFASVLPGTYTLKVSLAGFTPEERKGIRIGTQQTLVEDFTLGVGALSEQVTVTAEAPLVERG